MSPSEWPSLLTSRMLARCLLTLSKIAARAALRRKKQHEHTLDQTVAQISTLEQQIYSIEAANINRETLAAMEKAGAAMKQIHGKLNIDTVDETMYVLKFHLSGENLCWSLMCMYREKLREQHALGEEIANAITSAPIGDPVDEDELNDELEQLEQEQLDETMLRTGTVPVSDKINTLPAVVNGERTYSNDDWKFHSSDANQIVVKGKRPARAEEEDEEEELRKLQAEMAMS